MARRVWWLCRVRRSFFFFQAEDGIRDDLVTGVQTCALPIYAKRIEIAGDGRIESRAAGHQVAHASAEGGVNLSKENPSGIDSGSPQRTVERHQRSNQPQCQLAGLVQFFEVPLLHQVEKLRHNAN